MNHFVLQSFCKSVCTKSLLCVNILFKKRSSIFKMIFSLFFSHKLSYFFRLQFFETSISKTFQSGSVT